MCEPSKVNLSIRLAQLWCGWCGSHPEQSLSRLSPSAWLLHSCPLSRALAPGPPGTLKGRCLAALVIACLKWTGTLSLTGNIQTVINPIQHKYFTFQDTHLLNSEGFCMKMVATDSVCHPLAHIFFSPTVDNLLKLIGAFLSMGANISGMTVLSLWVRAQEMKMSCFCDKKRWNCVSGKHLSFTSFIITRYLLGVI